MNRSERSIITVFDSNTKEVVRQIPSEEVVAIARQIRSDPGSAACWDVNGHQNIDLVR